MERLKNEGGVDNKEHVQGNESLNKEYLEGVSMEQITTIYEKVKKKIEDEGLEINPVFFNKALNPKKGIFQDSEIRRDFDIVAELEKIFEQSLIKCINEGETQKKKVFVADIFEKVLPILINKGGVFGNESSARLAAPYDDYVNGIDVVVDLGTSINNSTLGLAVDLTISKISIRKKLSGIKDKLDNGLLSIIKYYKTADESFVGTKHNIIPLIITSSPERVLKISSDIVYDNNFHKDETLVFEFQSLEEALFQLKAFLFYCEEDRREGYAMENHNKTNKLIEFIKKDLKELQYIFDTKVKDIGVEKYEEIRVRYDENFEELNSQIKDIFNN